MLQHTIKGARALDSAILGLKHSAVFHVLAWGFVAACILHTLKSAACA